MQIHLFDSLLPSDAHTARKSIACDTYYAVCVTTGIEVPSTNLYLQEVGSVKELNAVDGSLVAREYVYEVTGALDTTSVRLDILIGAEYVQQLSVIDGVDGDVNAVQLSDAGTIIARSIVSIPDELEADFVAITLPAESSVTGSAIPLVLVYSYNQ